MRPTDGQHFGFLSTFPPTRCGLATFTESLAEAIGTAAVVRVMDDAAVAGSDRPAPGTLVVAELAAGDHAGIRRAAEALNRNDAAIIQHEYGIYGGRDGEEVVAVMSQVTVPMIMVLHTVLEQPTAHQKLVLERVAALADAVVVMTETAAGILRRRYSVARERIAVIPHGVPSWTPSAAPTHDTPLVVTWGLIGPGKGIEWGIRAVALLRDSGEPTRYAVHGQTHPEVLARFGDTYRDELHALIDDLDLGALVTLDDRYLGAAELAAVVGSADAVLLPYDSRDQVTSGVLVEALAAGKSVVATGFPHAIELLDGRRGAIAAHEDPESMAAALRRMLLPDTGEAPEAYEGVLETEWPVVAAQYRQLAARLRSERAA
ncbi:glycosyltransferase [Microbacteriaceae bacterium VKM Ac-2855]|nr:glycosyltransferase [Microbacteriaceae bacterium VKM Ac-2855]